VCYIQEVNTVFRDWQKANAPILERVGIDTKPKEVIRKISEGILQSFADINLVDKYDVYQHLMTYWLETMQDDAHLIAGDGWKAELSHVKGKKDEWGSDLLPKQLVINRYFAAEQKVIAQLEADCDAIRRQKEAMKEEHSGKDGLLEEVKTDKGKISRGNLQKRIKEIKNYVDAIEELEVLVAYLELMELEVGANRKIKDAQKAQDKKVIDRYKALTEDEVKTMVVGDKWLAAISGDVNTEVERISQRLTQRIKELAERYATPMPELNTNVDALEAG
jgi:type I restriction enzyme M protein